MSDTEMEVDLHEGGAEAPEQHHDDTEARARLQGWKPASELRVQPRGGVLSAEEFLARGEAEGPILRERLRNQEGQLIDLNKKLDAAAEVITKMNDRFRTVDQRAYARARADLEKERDAAIQNADVREVRRIDGEIRELDKEAPAHEAPRTTVAKAASDINPDAAAWLADGNDWFTKSPDLAQEAQALHLAYQQSHPGLTTRQNLDKVSATIRKLYPDRFENPRRAAPPAVSPSSENGAGRRVDPKSFDALPQDSKKEFERYVKALAGKGRPLTKDEWAQYYHEGN